MNQLADISELWRVGQSEIVRRDRAGRAKAQQVQNNPPRGDLALGRVGAVQNLIEQKQRCALPSIPFDPAAPERVEGLPKAASPTA